uniref:Carboxypeptidase N subunit 2-like n=1 Tax=Saccoglossus kowalevskii TaxID=10224 RepID=A0ABM0M7B5_SACKO
MKRVNPSRQLGRLLVIAVVSQAVVSFPKQVDCGNDLPCRCLEETFSWGSDVDVKQNSSFVSLDDYSLDANYSYEWSSTVYTESTLTVDCRSSNLKRIPYTIPYNVTKLWVSHNSIVYVARVSLAHCREIVQLDASYNAISHIDRDAFINMENINTIYLSNNQLTDLPRELFNHTIHLTFLDVSHNQLKRLPVINSNIPALYILLSFNQISQMELINQQNYKTFTFIGLDISNNKLRSIPDNVVRRLNEVFAERYGEIILDGNPWVCDCEMVSVKRAWPHHPHYIRDTIYCNTPDNLKGKNMWNIPESQL